MTVCGSMSYKSIISIHDCVWVHVLIDHLFDKSIISIHDLCVGPCLNVFDKSIISIHDCVWVHVLMCLTSRSSLYMTVCGSMS